MVKSSCRIGIDIGGTFTDVVLSQEGQEGKGEVYTVKVPTTPADPSIGAQEGVRRILQLAGMGGGDVTFFSHGTTVGTNAILEGKLAKTVLVTTHGFRDVLEIGRQRRPQQYNFFAEKSPVPIRRALRFTVRERIDCHGEVLIPLAMEEVLTLIPQLRQQEVESVAVCLLFSFLNPCHEQQVGKVLMRELPGLEVYLSSEILPEYREYERTCTVSLNAAVAPVVTRYLDHFADRMRGVGIGCDLHIMKSSGGVTSFKGLGKRAIETVLSGPAAGALGVAYLGSISGHQDVIGLDMGGTSCDVSVIINGKANLTTEGKIGDYPVKVPIIDIATIGAGGGSIAWIDEAGALHVGPQSAGADPGPVCYGTGGRQPTVTDANLCLGRLDPHYFLGGEMELDAAAAAEAIREQVGLPLSMGLLEVAQGIIDIANSNMIRAIRLVSVEKGYDPRDFALMAFGGAGPLHAASLAADLGIPVVVVPEGAGILSAQGLLVADMKNDYSLTRIGLVKETDPQSLEEAFKGLEQRALLEFMQAGIGPERIGFQYALDMRYRGQTYEIRVPVADRLDSNSLAASEKHFHQSHEQLYWWRDETRPVELVNLRLSATVEVSKLRLAGKGGHGDTPAAALKGRRQVFFSDSRSTVGRYVTTSIYDRQRLGQGQGVKGPAIIESADTTTLIPPGQVAEVDGYGNILIHVRLRGARGNNGR